MNNMKKMALLLLVAAASNSAQALDEVIRLQAGQAFTLHSKAEAVGTGLPPKYQWYRDGSPIEGATSPDYTIPAGQAVGSNVQFKRAAYTDGCAERMFTNTVTITWCNLLLNGVCWADANVAQPGTFAPRPDMFTEYYQWNQPNKAWPASGEFPAGTTWPTNISAPAWTATPCPEGWRLPTLEEFQALHNAGGELSGGTVGGIWAIAGAKGNAVAGRFYGSNYAACTLPSNMVGCVFIPASGTRIYYSNGALNDQGAFAGCWSSTQGSATTGHRLAFRPISSNTNTGNKAEWYNVRCVQ